MLECPRCQEKMSLCNGLDGDQHWLCTCGHEESSHDPDVRVIRLRRNHAGYATAGKYGHTVDELRAKISAWHFATEALSPIEREMLFVAEQLLAELDHLAGHYLS